MINQKYKQSQFLVHQLDLVCVWIRITSTAFAFSASYSSSFFFTRFALGQGTIITIHVLQCRTVCLTNPSNHQLVKDEGAHIFYSIQSQTKPIGIGANCEIPHNPALTMRLQRLEPMTLALIPLVGPCALPIHPTTNW